MSTSLGQDIFRRFGPQALVVVLVGPVAVWALAHYNAAPGGVVKVLWGLVEYTKKTPTTSLVGAELSSQTPAGSASPSPKQQDTALQSAQDGGRIEVIAHGYSEAAYPTRQSELRRQRGLRELSELESGQPLVSLPTGAFGFVSHTSFLIGGSDLASRLQSAAVRRFPSGDEPPFEVQARAAVGMSVVGFATETAAAALASGQSKQIALSPRPSGDLSTLVSISISRLSRMDWRLIELAPKKNYFIMDVLVR